MPLLFAPIALFSALGIVGCGNSNELDSSPRSPFPGTNSPGPGNDTTPGNSGSGSTNDGRQLIPVEPIAGGGVTAGPLKPGCGPETARECAPPGGGCNDPAFLNGGLQVVDAGSTCFFGPEREKPAATVEYITEINQGVEYLHLRVIFDPHFVDTVYGVCSTETGWKPKGKPGGPGDNGMSTRVGHTFKDLINSDHVELLLENCAGDLSMHMKVDFISEDDSAACGYGSLGVQGGEGKMFIGDAKDVLAVSTSLDRNLNGCGYCETVDSPCPEDPSTFSASPEAPEWDFRMVYELWIKGEAFGNSKFCQAKIEYVHASPAKGTTDTILVEPDDCPPPPGGECPFDYELYLSTEGEYICVGPPTNGMCPDGFALDLTSEGELCVPIDER